MLPTGENRRVYIHWLCLLFSKITYPQIECAPAFHKDGAHFSLPFFSFLPDKWLKNVRCKVKGGFSEKYIGRYKVFRHWPKGGEWITANRTRPIRIEFCVTEQEKQLSRYKMTQLGTKNMGAYLRKMAIDGYIIMVDYTQQKKLAAAISRAESNINQICRRINSTGRFYAEDVAELKERQIEIWSLLKETQKKEL